MSREAYKTTTALLESSLRVGHELFYLLGLASCCIFCYFFFILTTSIYVGYLFLTAFVWVFLKRLRISLLASRYRCGRCGQKLREKGVCPHCGAINE